ncbi:MAG TPA: glycosyltransferase family 4 protein [Chthoniobacterales bacterium]
MKTLLIIDSHPVQYRAPIYKELARLLSDSGGRLHVIYASDSSVRGALDEGFGQAITWDEPLLEGYDHEFLPDAQQVGPGGFRNLVGRGIERAIRSHRPQAIFLNGLNYLVFVRALLAARVKGVPVWLRSETQDHAFARSGWKSKLRNAVYRVAYSQVDRFFPIGELNAEHYRAHGVPDEKLTYARYCVVDRFTVAPEEKERRRRSKRTELGIADSKMLLMFSGKLIEKKNPGILFDALELLSPSQREQFALLFVGNGELEASLQARMKAIPEVKVIFTGFVNQGEIADYYLAADALVLPSRQMGETWGLVANEALLAGIPVLLSRHAGSSRDFGNFEGVQVFEPTADCLKDCILELRTMARGESLREQMKSYSIGAAAEAIQKQFLEQMSRT